MEKYREQCREQRAESRKQRAESSERCPPGKKPTLQVVVGTDLYIALKIGTGTTTVKRGGPPGSKWCLAGEGLLARGRDDK